MKHFALALLVAAGLAARPAAPRAPALHPAAVQPQMQRAEGSVDAMGSTFTIVAYGTDAGKLESAVEASLDEARRLDHLLSNYLPDSEWSKVNREAANHPVVVSPELFQVLSACVRYSSESEGTFDITVGPLMRVWGFYKGSGHLPHRAEVRGALSNVGWRNIVLDPKRSAVSFAKRGTEIDPGGIGKGYAVDKMAAILRQNGVTAALISGGSSSIYAIGAPPGEPGWKINIKDPRNPSKSISSATLKDESLSTSGNYEKYFYAEGKMWSHIMDPRTGYPAMGTLSVSIITPKTIDSEAWAKPYYILGRKWTAQHKPKNYKVFYCEDRMDTPCAWLP